MIRTATRLLPLLLAAATLQACGTTSAEKNTAVASQAITPTEQFPIEVRQDPDEIQLAIHERGLSQGQVAALTAMVDRWRDTGGGVVTIRAPRAADGLGGAYAQAATRAVVDLGVPIEQVRLVGYDSPPGQPAPLLVGFASYRAVGPNCGEWDSFTKTGQNKPYANFGCAVSADIAAQIANPRDLLAPQPMTPADATRRQAVLEKYRKGDITSTTKDEQATATTKTPGGGG